MPLAVWGRYDPSFVSAGAKVFRRNGPSARLALETDGEAVADETRRFI